MRVHAVLQDGADVSYATLHVRDPNLLNTCKPLWKLCCSYMFSNTENGRIRLYLAGTKSGDVVAPRLASTSFHF